MENASKALIIAGSVLLAMLIIGTLIFMFTNLSNLRQTEADSSTVQKLEEYNRQIELYNKANLYGSEVLSLANLIEDYNIRQAEYKGYTAITLEIYTNQIKGVDAPIMQTKYNTSDAYLKLTSDYKKLTNTVDNLSGNIIYANYTARELAGMTDEQIVLILKQNGENVEISDIQDNKLQYNATYIMIKNQISEYEQKSSELTQFKRKIFQAPQVEYDEITGRVKSMTFYEQGYTN